LPRFTTNDEIKEYADYHLVAKDKLMPIQRHCEEVFPTKQSNLGVE